MISDEIRLVRLCSRVAINDAGREKIRSILVKDLDWRLFAENFRINAVGGLVYRTVEQDPELKRIVPAGVQDQLRNIYYCILERNLVFSKALEEVAVRIKSGNTELIVLKGMMLCESVYHDPGLRPMSDIDVMVRFEDLKPMDVTLRELGYSAGTGYRNGVEAYQTCQRNSILYSRHKDSTIFLHLYWNLINSLPFDPGIAERLDMKRIWDASRRIDPDKSCLRAFSLDHQLIHLCLHAMHHSFRPLVFLCDINESVRRNIAILDWKKLSQEAKDMGLSKYLYYGLYFSQQIMGLDVSPDVLNELRPQNVSVFEKRLIDSVLEGRVDYSGPGMVNLGMNESISGRLKFLLRISLPSKKEMSLIRQKSLSEVSWQDYFQRFRSAFLHIFGFAAGK